jgi:hypothetical protein
MIVVIPPRKGGGKLRVSLHGLIPESTYELHWEISRRSYSASGKELMKQLEATLPDGDGGERIVYRATKPKGR